jgi:hypothetical protein
MFIPVLINYLQIDIGIVSYNVNAVNSLLTLSLSFPAIMILTSWICKSPDVIPPERHAFQKPYPFFTYTLLVIAFKSFEQDSKLLHFT